jgi:plastocyanin
MKKMLASLCAVAVAAAVAVPALAAGPNVRVDDDFFKAKTVRIKKNTTVKWTWVGERPHNVVFKGFKSKIKETGTYRHTFKKTGTYRYVCTLHSDKGMKGTVVVSR